MVPRRLVALGEVSETSSLHSWVAAVVPTQTKRNEHKDNQVRTIWMPHRSRIQNIHRLQTYPMTLRRTWSCNPTGDYLCSHGNLDLFSAYRALPIHLYSVGSVYLCLSPSDVCLLRGVTRSGTSAWRCIHDRAPFCSHTCHNTCWICRHTHHQTFLSHDCAN